MTPQVDEPKAGATVANAGTPSRTVHITKHARYREILTILARHGIAVVDEEFVKHEAGDRARAEQLRLACEQLGPVFIKLGQFLSTRGDLLPDVYCRELARLQDEVVPVPAEAIAEVIREDLGAPPEQLLVSFDREPLGSASIAQVHAARLLDGRDVVLKVRKPGVDELVQVDLEILNDLVRSWTPRFEILRQYDAPALVREFADDLREELDYSREAANITLFRNLFATEPGFTIPAVVQEYSKNRVLTEDRVAGRKTTELADLPARLRAVVSRRIARFVLEPAFGHGVFYADPHPGNFFIGQDGVLSVVDFGKVGRLSPEARQQLSDLFVAIARCDAQRLSDHLIEITAPTHPIDRDALARELDRMLALYVDVSIEHVQFGEATSELLQLIRRHGLQLPGVLVLFFKALAMCEAIMETIDPNASFLDYLQPMIGKMIYQGHAGREGLERLRDSALDAVELTIGLPQRIDRVLGEIERGNLRVWTRIEDADPLVKRFERMIARSNATILAAACIVGLAVVMLFYHPHGWQVWIGAVFWVAVAVAVIDLVRTLLALRK